MSKILLIEDNFDMIDCLVQQLEMYDYTIFTALNGKEGLEQLTAVQPDLIIVDLNLPDIPGLEIIKRIKILMPNLPVFVLTGSKLEKDQKEAFDLLVDEYILKPHIIHDLILRINKALKKSIEENGQHITQYPALNSNTKEIKINGSLIHLTTKEYDLLVYFIKNLNHYLSSDQLLKKIWNDDMQIYYGSMKTTIYNIRQKIEEDPKNPKLLTGSYGKGYKINKISD
jgi:DNA-binding response OmpR family regulator